MASQGNFSGDNNYGVQLGVNRGSFTTNHYHVPVVKQKEDFSFHKPFGVCLGQAPRIDPELFIGRNSELNEMKEVLKPGDSSRGQRRLVLGGVGGIGKTQLAIIYAERHHNMYDSIFWLNASSEATLNNSFRSIAELVFDVQGPDVLEGRQALIHVHQWLSDTKNTRWLLIFDNFDNPNLFKIENYYPPGSHGALVITTRRPDLVAGIDIRIQPLQNVEESLAILQTRSKQENAKYDPYAKKLATRLDGLPLALATAGAYVQRRSFTFKGYLQEYEKQWKIDSRRLPQLPEYQDRTLYTTWDLSYADLEKNDPDAARLLKLLAYFSNQSLWYELLRAGLTRDSPKWLHEVMADDISFKGIMGKLTDYCFLETQLVQQSWSMHACVHDWTLAILNNNLDSQHYWYAFECVAESTICNSRDSFEHLSYSRLAAHATWLVQQSFQQDNLLYNIAPNQLDKALSIADLLRKQVRLIAAEQMYQLALAGKEKALGPDHTSTLSTVDNLGILYKDQGKLKEAERMYERALAGKEKALGPDHTITLSTVHNLGLLYKDQGKLKEAERMYERALAGKEKALGPDHTSTLSTVNNLGLLYKGQGKLKEAERMYERALAGKEKALGPDHTSTLSTVGNLGLLYKDQGKLKEAERMYERALAGYKKALGPDHTSTLSTVHNLGLLYKDQGKLKEAERMYKRALAGKEKALGPDHISTLTTVNNLGILYSDQGKLKEAERMYERALAGYEKALGPDHRKTQQVAKRLTALNIADRT